MSKIIVIRIRGTVGVRDSIRQTLDLLRLRRRFVCVIVDDTKEIIGMIKKSKDYVSYGKIDKETLKLLIMKRGKIPGNKFLAEGGIQLENFLNDFLEGKKSFQDLGIKPFFRLHPPRGGFKKSVKGAWPKGILGLNPKINDLVKKML
jgi:large subunit ribosomal protein L30